ncbi:hypothetical protein LL06_08170 [Hoeflea sp. BAL378]|uniref:DUF1674 domain-containing protein n=1 Tax=Hoeflea sp. BAL378 TaxID=1547437 RepID=UPI000513BCD3|nr:DUF1674 domain-containing protein [Hoeflea sp. BAL378]KGF69892.1 hypothetical protein LL06_08170 [Hoeflea sp. BAL378]
MTTNSPPSAEPGSVDTAGTTAERVLSPAAKRALAEAEARRQAREQQRQAAEKEIGGRGGADPARFGDWEINGRAIDF